MGPRSKTRLAIQVIALILLAACGTGGAEVASSDGAPSNPRPTVGPTPASPSVRVTPTPAPSEPPITQAEIDLLTAYLASAGMTGGDFPHPDACSRFGIIVFGASLSGVSLGVPITDERTAELRSRQWQAFAAVADRWLPELPDHLQPTARAYRDAYRPIDTWNVEDFEKFARGDGALRDDVTRMSESVPQWAADATERLLDSSCDPSSAPTPNGMAEQAALDEEQCPLLESEVREDLDSQSILRSVRGTLECEVWPQEGGWVFLEVMDENVFTFDEFTERHATFRTLTMTVDGFDIDVHVVGDRGQLFSWLPDGRTIWTVPNHVTDPEVPLRLHQSMAVVALGDEVPGQQRTSPSYVVPDEVPTDLEDFLVAASHLWAVGDHEAMNAYMTPDAIRKVQAVGPVIRVELGESFSNDCVPGSSGAGVCPVYVTTRDETIHHFDYQFTEERRGDDWGWRIVDVGQ